MGKGVKAFSKNAPKFKLVHRSQRDPLAADPDAAQMVLVPLNDPHGEEQAKVSKQRGTKQSHPPSASLGAEASTEHSQAE